MTTKNLKVVSLIILLFAASWLSLEPDKFVAAEPSAPAIVVDSILAAGFNTPVGVYHAGDGSDRLFIVEQTGKIKIVKDGLVLPVPYLSLDPDTQVLSGGERGLLGLAFHPDYESNGWFFVNYTRQPDGQTIVARYQVSSNPDIADLTSGVTILSVGQPYANHNGGHIAFGADGYLYIGMGDGGSGGDPQNYALDMNSLLGKMLRIDVNQTTPGKLYAVPPGNLRDEIWALGLRNPWFWSFDRINGDLYIGDVGQNAWEEVDYRRFNDPPGANFGWSCLEGTHSYRLNRYPCSDPDYVAETIRPIAEFSHAEGQSITGGYVYRGGLYPNLSGSYFYADFSTGKIWSLEKTSDFPLTFSDPVFHLDADYLISCFGEDEGGELYVCDYYGGSIRRIQDASGAAPNLTESQFSATPVYADFGDVVTYTLELVNTGGESSSLITAEIDIPTGLTYINSSPGVDDSAAPTLIWQGTLSSNVPEVITYSARVDLMMGNPITPVLVSGSGYDPITLKRVIFIPKPALQTTAQDFIMPGTQPGTLIDQILLPATCDVCHTEMIYDTWRGSMMSHAGVDPLFWAALEVANRDAPGSGEFCLRCHTPKAWLEGRSSAADGSLLTQADLDAGVTCEICHRAVDPIPSMNPDDQARARDEAIRNSISPVLPSDHVGSGMLIFDPQDFRRGPFDLGDFNYHPNETFRSDFLGGNPSDPIARSRLCGSCHNVDNPILSWDQLTEEYLPNAMDSPAPSQSQDALFSVETTYDEWLNSDFASTTACQDCHMRHIKGFAAEEFFNPDYRDCKNNGCLPVHEFVGGNTWVPQLLQDPRWRLNRQDLGSLLNGTVLNARAMLQRAAKVNLQFQAGSSTLAYRITNLTGHKLPTGYAEGRRMWLQIQAFDANDIMVFSTCDYDPLTGELTEDPNCKVFEVKQALTPQMSTLLNSTVPSGPSFHFVLNNSVYKDNRIPPAGFTGEALSRRTLMPTEAGLPSNIYAPGQNFYENTITLPSDVVRVTAFLYYQTASKEYIEFLEANGGVDAQSLNTIWVDNMNPPELVAWSAYPIYPTYMPLIHR